MGAEFRDDLARGFAGTLDFVRGERNRADPGVAAEIQKAVEGANTRLSRPEEVKKFTILPTTWTAESGELTPKLSMRRRVIELDRGTLVRDQARGVYA